MDDRQIRRLGWGLLGLFALLLVATAWVHEDAFITFRVIDNFLHGDGLRWNVDERVQVYTHPLWLFVAGAAVAVTGEYPLTVLALAFVLSLATLYLLIFRLARSPEAGCFWAVALILSKAFVDYATSGLEDPLTRLLLAVFVLLQLGSRPPGARQLGWLSLVAALVALCRPDLLLLVVPTLLFRLSRLPRERRPRAVGAAALGFLPLALWGLFALVYYGSLLPNPAYAKLGMGVPRLGLVAQGFAYLLDSLLFDPVTLVAITLAVAWAVRRPHRVATPLAAGVVLYLAFVVWIGGDYMSGRFLGAPLFASVLGLVLRPLPRWQPRRVALVAVLLLVARLAGPLWSGGDVHPFLIADERRFYFPSTGLASGLLLPDWPAHRWRAEGEALRRAGPAVVVADNVGLLGFYAGPDVHLVDTAGLADPLLARLPAEVGGAFIPPRPATPPWRPGHGTRRLPAGYVESLQTGRNRLADPDLARYYAALRAATRAPIWNAERLRTVAGLNLGRYDRWRDAYVASRRAAGPSGRDDDGPQR